MAPSSAPAGAQEPLGECVTQALAGGGRKERTSWRSGTVPGTQRRSHRVREPPIPPDKTQAHAQAPTHVYPTHAPPQGAHMHTRMCVHTMHPTHARTPFPIQECSRPRREGHGLPSARGPPSGTTDTSPRPPRGSLVTSTTTPKPAGRVWRRQCAGCARSPVRPCASVPGVSSPV